jgi:hypothetical protein
VDEESTEFDYPTRKYGKRKPGYFAGFLVAGDILDNERTKRTDPLGSEVVDDNKRGY